MNKTTKTLTYVIGIIMTIAMVGSLILPMLSSNIGQAEVDAEAGRPTPLPEPTLPPPPDTASISFDRAYLHESGLFHDRRACRLEPKRGQQYGGRIARQLDQWRVAQRSRSAHQQESCRPYRCRSAKRLSRQYLAGPFLERLFALGRDEPQNHR